jgi:flagellin
VFSGIAAGNAVTVNGLTFTATAAMTAAQVGVAFSGVLTGETAAQVTARNTVSAALGTYSGTNTAGYASAVTATSTAIYTSVADAAATFAAAPTSTGTTENSVITFKALNPNDFVTVNGLTFTARVNMTANEVAAAFANVTSGATAAELTLANPVAANFGKYSGTFTAGFSTGDATTTGTVTATSTTQNVDVTNLAVKGVLASTSTITTAGSTVAASTVYGTVTLNSQNSFTIKPGAKAYATETAPALDPTYANFTALGFEAKTINPKNIGRLNFQVGPAANQLISIDLADFGKNGDITGPITSDTAPTNLLTVNSSNDVIMNVNKSLDRIAATRATMGAVMNRLEHVMDNLTNVVMNSEASRSQIEDADYAQASTELARTQIMQQAATAVLAQANTSQQTVLKLLQG